MRIAQPAHSAETVQHSTCQSQDRFLVVRASTTLATDAVTVAIAHDGPQRLPDASDGSSTADEPPAADLWSLLHGRPVKLEHARLVPADFRGRISDGREYRGQEEEDCEGRILALAV